MELKSQVWNDGVPQHLPRMQVALGSIPDCARFFLRSVLSMSQCQASNGLCFGQVAFVLARSRLVRDWDIGSLTLP